MSELALYRYFDATDTLLYIGKTWRLATRETTHIARSRWMCLAARSAIERYPSADALRDAERKAIEIEHPLFNVQYNDAPEARERLRVYLDEIGRPDLLSGPKRVRSPVLAGRPWPKEAEAQPSPEPEVAAERTVIATTADAGPVMAGSDTLLFKRLATALIQPAREALGMDHGEFASHLDSALGWKAMPDAVRRWEAGSMPPGDVFLACGDIVRRKVAVTPGFPLSAESRVALTLITPSLEAADLDPRWPG